MKYNPMGNNHIIYGVNEYIVVYDMNYYSFRRYIYRYSPEYYYGYEEVSIDELATDILKVIARIEKHICKQNIKHYDMKKQNNIGNIFSKDFSHFAIDKIKNMW